MEFTNEEKDRYKEYYGFEYDCDCPICTSMMTDMLEQKPWIRREDEDKDTQ